MPADSHFVNAGLALSGLRAREEDAVSPAVDSSTEFRDHTGGPFRRVLVAWDGSPDSVAALRTATAIAGTGRCHVVALSVVPSAPPREASQDPGTPWPGQAQRVAEAFETTRAAIARTSPARLTLHTLESTHIAGSVCEYAAEHGFDLLVIGRHGDGGLIHPKLGHIAELAARSCPIPVLLVSAG